MRLLTLTGPGGVGKTRLALESARAAEAGFADGAHFVSLAAVQRPEDVPAAFVSAIGIPSFPGELAAEAVERFLAAKRLLLIADNLEHLLGAAPFIGGLLATCPALTVLATSREPLALHAEERYPVSPLGLPRKDTRQDAETLAGIDAVALFTERARAHDPGFELSDGNAAAVAEICRRVDGLPLAIELAAARCGLLSPDEIAERLRTALWALGAGARDAPSRQQTLRATIDWSHDLLIDDEKPCFARFAVFVGGATVEAAETITGASLDTLDGLVAKSLLVRRQPAHVPTRLSMLETIRAYATERLTAAVDREVVHERHHAHYLALAQRHGNDRALSGSGRAERLAKLDAEIDNFYTALAWAVGLPSAQRALEMVAGLGSYWLMSSRYDDAVRWIDHALTLPEAGLHPTLQVRALCVKAACLWSLGRLADRPHVMDEAEAIARQVGDPTVLSQALQAHADYESADGRLDVADRLADEALRWARAADDKWEIAHASRVKARGASTIEELLERVERAAPLLEEVGDTFQLADLLASAAYDALCKGGDREARAFVDRALPIVRQLDYPFMSMIVSGNLGLAALFTGDIDVARGAFREELTLCRELVVRPIAEGLRGLAAVAVAQSDFERAARLLGIAAAHRYDQPDDPLDTRLRERFFEAARTRRGVDAGDAAYRDGAALSFEQAIAYALEETHP